MIDITFDGGGAHGGDAGTAVTLAGTLALPDGSGPHPSVVLVGGSGPSDRDNDVLFPPIRAHLVAAGFAVLSYDKRGVGGSTGAWLDAGVADLAADAAAAYRVLRARSEVGPAPVGLFGHSEGGWVVLRAAAGALRDDGVAWVVTNSGPGVGPEPQERYALLTGVRAAGEPSPVVEACVGLYDRIVDAARRGAGFAEADALLRGDPAYPQFARFGVELSPPLWTLMKRYADHDPAPDAGRLRCPHLAVFGAADPIMPVADSVAAFAAAAGGPERSDAGHDLTVEVFAGANHRLHVDGGARFAPGYLGTLSRWMTSHNAAWSQRCPAA